MPSKTFTIQYNANDFFYNTADITQNQDLLSTFPFKKEDVIIWANKVANPNPHITDIYDIFDPQISEIILNPSYDFKNTFLPGNMVFNTDFNNITLSLSGKSNATSSGTTGDTSTVKTEEINNLTNQSAPITGSIVLESKDPNQESATLEINSGANSNIQWTQDDTNSWQSSFDINAALSQELPFTDVDGGSSTVILTTNNPRCKVRKTCTMNHWHYSGGCTSQIITGANGSSCKCNCQGVPVFDNAPHSHCDPYNIENDGSASTPLGPVAGPPGLGLVAAIQGMKLNLNAKFPQSQFGDLASALNNGSGAGGASGNVSDLTFPFKDSSGLIQNDETIRQIIFDYYTEVNKNIKLQKTVNNKGEKSATSDQALVDANVQYKTEYLNVFNIIAGIFGAAGYIYLMGKT
jgi:hypothetical protein